MQWWNAQRRTTGENPSRSPKTSDKFRMNFINPLDTPCSAGLDRNTGDIRKRRMNGSNREIGESFGIIFRLWHNQQAPLVLKNPDCCNNDGVVCVSSGFEDFVYDVTV